jgi:hypothetical protein
VTTQNVFSKMMILGGIQHSGTTLLLDMLRAHSRVFGPFELGLLLANGIDEDALAKWQARYSLQSRLLDHNYGINLAVLRGFVAETGGNWLTIYGRIFNHMTRVDKVEGRDIFIDKKPDYTDHLISHVYPKVPDVPAIIIVRDPRAVYWSWCKRTLAKRPLKRIVSYYVRSLRVAATALRASKPILLLRFEELVLAPEQHMRQAAQFLGLDYDPAMVSPRNSYAQDTRTKFTYPPRSGTDRRQLRPAEPDRTAIDEWRSQLAPDDADDIVTMIPNDLTWALYQHERATGLPSTTVEGKRTP